jgi:hypothetical protein
VKFWVNKATKTTCAQLKIKMMQRKKKIFKTKRWCNERKKYSKQKDDANDNKNEQTLVASKYKFTYIMGSTFAKKKKKPCNPFSVKVMHDISCFHYYNSRFFYLNF